jgi:hypothetical protein
MNTGRLESRGQRDTESETRKKIQAQIYRCVENQDPFQNPSGFRKRKSETSYDKKQQPRGTYVAGLQITTYNKYRIFPGG